MKIQHIPWTCPACSEVIDNAVPIETTTRRNTVTVSLGETALAEVFAHAWTHTEVTA